MNTEHQTPNTERQTTVLNLLIPQYDFNLLYAKMLVEDVSEEQMTSTPFKGFENHPAFTLGHLVTGSAMMAEDLGGVPEIPDGWAELFIRKGPGDPRLPSTDVKRYPEKKKLLDELEKQHELVKRILSSMNDEKLSEDIKWRFSKHMPKVKDLTLFMCVNHEAMHLGQLAAWRRAMGLDSALGRI